MLSCAFQDVSAGYLQLAALVRASIDPNNDSVRPQLVAAGVNVLVLSWWGQGDRKESADTQVRLATSPWWEGRVTTRQ